MGIADSALRDRMVFIVGARRSGTNWLQRILCAHPDTVAVPSETHLFSHGFAPLVDRFQHGAVASPKTAKVYFERDAMLDALRTVADEVFGRLATALRPEAHLIVERTPWHAHHLDLIGAVYPDAAVMHIVRDGRDVARSLLAQPWGPSDMHGAALEWRTAVERGRRAGSALARYREVRYEQLLASPAAELASLYTWLGLDVAPAIVDAAVLEAGVLFNTDRANPGVSEGKWRELSPVDQRTFDRVAGDMLQSLGYEREPAPPVTGDLAGSARSALRAARRALRRGTPTVEGALPDLDRPVQPRRQSLDRMERVQQLVDTAMEAFSAGDGKRVREFLAPSALVDIVEGTEARGRDDAAHAALQEAIARDARRRGSQRRADVHIGERLVTVVATYDDGAGGAERHTIVLGIRGDLVDRFLWYRPAGA